MRKWIINSFFVALAVYLLYYSFSQIKKEEWENIFSLLKHTHTGFVVLGAIVATASHVFRSQRWLILIDGAETHAFSLRRSVNAFGSLMIGYFLNMLVPRVGEVVRCTNLAKYEKTSSMELLGNIIVERAFDFVCLLIVFAITFGLQSTLLYDYLLSLLEHNQPDKKHLLQQLFWILLIVVVVGILIWIAIRKIPKVQSWGKEIWKGIWSIRHLRRKWTFLLYTFGMWFCYIFCLWIAFQTFSETSYLSWGAAFAVISVGSVAMIVVQGGIGAYPLMVMQMLQLYEVSRPMGFTLGWLVWLTMSVIAILLGSFFYFFLPYYNRHQLPKKNGAT